MRITTAFAAILALGACAAAPVMGGDNDTTTKQEAGKDHEVAKTITLAEAPKAVQKTIKAEIGDKKLIKLEKIVLNKGQDIVYQASFAAGDEKPKVIRINEDGSLGKKNKKKN